MSEDNLEPKRWISLGMLAEFRKEAREGSPRRRTRNAVALSARQVEGLRWAFRLRSAMNGPASKRLAVQQAFVYENVDPELLEGDASDLEAEVFRFHRYGPMGPLEAAQFFHYCLSQFAFEANANVAEGEEKVVQNPRDDYPEERQSTLDAIWRARQVADKLDLDYGTYIAAVVQGMRASGRTKAVRFSDFASRSGEKHALAWKNRPR